MGMVEGMEDILVEQRLAANELSGPSTVSYPAAQLSAGFSVDVEWFFLWVAEASRQGSYIIALLGCRHTIQRGYLLLVGIPRHT